MPANTVKVDRSTRWGNPWATGAQATFNWPMDVHPWTLSQCQIGFANLSSAEAASIFERHLAGAAIDDDYLPIQLTARGRHVLARDLNTHRRMILDNAHYLRGKNLACWCKLDAPCHADVLLEIANG